MHGKTSTESVTESLILFITLSKQTYTSEFLNCRKNWVQQIYFSNNLTHFCNLWLDHAKHIILLANFNKKTTGIFISTSILFPKRRRNTMSYWLTIKKYIFIFMTKGDKDWPIITSIIWQSIYKETARYRTHN